jgi:hypothetical protein
MTLHPIPLNFLICEENFIFFFISVKYDPSSDLGIWDSHNTFPASECAPPPPKQRLGESQFRRLAKKLSAPPTLCLWWNRTKLRLLIMRQLNKCKLLQERGFAIYILLNCQCKMFRFSFRTTNCQGFTFCPSVWKPLSDINSSPLSLWSLCDIFCTLSAKPWRDLLSIFSNVYVGGGGEGVEDLWDIARKLGELCRRGRGKEQNY